MGTKHRSSWAGIGFYLVLSSAAHSQQYFITSTYCDSFVPAVTGSITAGERILFEGTAVQFDANGTAVMGDMIFAVNQNTGTWSMFVIYPDGTTCEISLGGDFAPVSHN